MVTPFIKDFESQVTSQPKQLDLLSTRWDEIRFLTNTIRGSFSKPYFIQITGCGDSYHIAQLGAHMFTYHASKEPHTGSLKSCIPADAFQTRVSPKYQKRGSRLLFSISASGETPQTFKAQTVMSEEGWFSIALTNNALSTLSDQSDTAFSTNVEAGTYHHPVATTNAGIWTLQAIASNFLSFNPQTPSYAESYHALQHIPSILSTNLKSKRLLKQLDSAANVINQFQNKKSKKPRTNLPPINILGGGHLQPIANLLALKIGEVTWNHAKGYNIEEYIHSPLLTATPSTSHIFILSSEEMYHRSQHLATFFCQHNIPFIDIAPRGYPELVGSETSIRFQISTFPEPYLAIPMLFIGQLFILSLAKIQEPQPEGWRYGKAHSQLIKQA